MKMEELLCQEVLPQLGVTTYIYIENLEVFQKRRGNRDNLGIIFLISP